MIKQIMFTSSHLIRYPYISLASWSLLLVLGEMAAPFRTQQNENTAVIIICGDPAEAEKVTSSQQIQAGEENQPSLKGNIRTAPAMFFRRRIVLLTMSLILAILIITVTIVGLVISSNNELTEAEARKAKINPETDSEQELMTSSINNDVPRVDDSDSIDERDSSSFLFPRDLKPTTTSDPISGSGSGHSTAEDEKKNFLHIEEQDNFMLNVETEKTEMPAVSHDEVGSGDSSGEDERHDNDSGSGSGSGSGSAFLNWFL